MVDENSQIPWRADEIRSTRVIVKCNITKLEVIAREWKRNEWRLHSKHPFLSSLRVMTDVGTFLQAG